MCFTTCSLLSKSTLRDMALDNLYLYFYNTHPLANWCFLIVRFYGILNFDNILYYL